MSATPRPWQAIGLAAAGGFLFLAAAATANAQDILETQVLSFGSVAISDNNTKQTLRIGIDGRVSSDIGIIPVLPGTPGQFTLIGFPPHQSLTIEFDTLVLSAAGDGLGQTFTVGFSYLPLVTTDANGEATINFGATLTTSGDGDPYLDSAYFGNGIVHILW